MIVTPAPQRVEEFARRSGLADPRRFAGYRIRYGVSPRRISGG
jgi:hypothetical protein